MRTMRGTLGRGRTHSVHGPSRRSRTSGATDASQANVATHLRFTERRTRWLAAAAGVVLSGAAWPIAIALGLPSVRLGPAEPAGRAAQLPPFASSPLRPGARLETSGAAFASAGADTTLASAGAARSLLRAYQATGATPTSGLVHDYTVLNDRFLSGATLTADARRLVSLLGIRRAAIRCAAQPDEHSVVVSAESPAGDGVRLYLTSLVTRSAAAPKAQTVLVVRWQTDGHGVDRLPAIVARVAHSVQCLGGRPLVSAYIRGVAPAPGFSDGEGDSAGTIRALAPNQRVRHALAAVGAHPVEGLADEGVTSISAYTAAIPGAIWTGAHWMNLQVAIHTLSGAPTLVVAGTPFIVDPY